jgi:predicted transcriptional regulator
MITSVRTLSATQPVSAAVDAVREGFQHDFPVVDDHGTTGVLTREILLKALAEGRADATVGDVMERSFSSVTPEESLERGLERLRMCRCQTLVVARGRELVGLLTAEKISEYVMIASAERAGHAHA